jgi:hypothetical protein
MTGGSHFSKLRGLEFIRWYGDFVFDTASDFALDIKINEELLSSAHGQWLSELRPLAKSVGGVNADFGVKALGCLAVCLVSCECLSISPLSTRSRFSTRLKALLEQYPAQYIGLTFVFHQHILMNAATDPDANLHREPHFEKSYLNVIDKRLKKFYPNGLEATLIDYKAHPHNAMWYASLLNL